MEQQPSIELGAHERGDYSPVRVSIPTLIDTRALVTGNSGAGKSRLLRRIAEQAFGQTQQIVIDPEGEFATLREKHAFLLAGRGGEVVAEPRAAALLAKRLMELRVSAVLDLYELRLQQRRLFVRLFLESLIDLDKSLYAPVIVMLDEAHLFCPEKDEAESASAVIDLMTRGRKRGICGILATQRLSKLDKDAAAEAKNVFVGGIVLDVDQKRAADTLGFATKEERLGLRDVKPGWFNAFGPALNFSGVVRFHAGHTFTTHPKAGERHTLTPPATPDAIRKVAGELKDLPEQAAEEIKTLQAAQQKIRDLERALKAQPKPAPPGPAKTREVPVLRDAQAKRLEAAAKSLAVILEAGANRMDKIGQGIGRSTAEVLEALQKARREGEHELHRHTMRDATPERVGPAQPGQVSSRTPPGPVGRVAGGVPGGGAPLRARTPARPSNGDLHLGGPERKLLTVLVQRGPRTVRQLALQAGYSREGGAFKNPLGRLRTSGLVEPGDPVCITQAGVAALGEDYDPLPTSGPALLNWWLTHGRLGGPERKILVALAEPEPQTLSVEALAERTGYELTGGAFKNPLGRLRTLELVTRGPMVRLAEELVG